MEKIPKNYYCKICGYPKHKGNNFEDYIMVNDLEIMEKHIRKYHPEVLKLKC